MTSAPSGFGTGTGFTPLFYPSGSGGGGPVPWQSPMGSLRNDAGYGTPAPSIEEQYMAFLRSNPAYNGGNNNGGGVSAAQAARALHEQQTLCESNARNRFCEARASC
jgi:hypothetical protein